MPWFAPSRLKRYSWPILLVWGLLLAASAVVYVGRFTIDNSVGIWFLDNDPELKRFREFGQAFGDSEWTFAEIRTKSINNKAFLKDLDRATARIEALPNVKSAISLTVQSGPAAPTLVENLLYRPGDNRHTAILIESDNRLFSKDAYRTELVDGVRKILGNQPTFEAFWLAGTTVVNAELNRAARRDMFVFYGLLSVLILLAGRAFLGNWRDVAVLVAILGGSVLPTLGLVVAAGTSFNMITIMLPTILVSMGASIAIHMINEFHERNRQQPMAEALDETVTTLVRPAFWTSLTTVVGFLSLTSSGVAPVRHVGELAAIGITLSFVNAIAVAPCLLRALWAGRDRALVRSQGPGDRLIGWSFALTRHRWKVVICAVALFAGGLSGLAHLRADTDYVEFFRDNSRMAQDYREMSETGFAQYCVDLDVKLPDRLGPGDAAALGNLATRIAVLPGVRKVLSVDQLLRSAPAGPTDNPGAAGPILAAFLSADGKRTRILILTDHKSSQQLGAFREEVTQLAKRYLPAGSDTEMVGTNVLWANMDTSVIRTQITSFGITFAFLLTLMPILTRSLRLGMTGVAVSVLPVLSILGVMGWMGITVNMATCLIGGVALGVAIDDTIYLLMRYRRVQASGDPADAVASAVRLTGRAMITTSIVITGGFMSMGLSDFLPTAQFGLLFALTIIAALTADLLLLPALLPRGQSTGARLGRIAR